MIRTHVILDGLQDPLAGQQLSARWASVGFNNAVDVAGQCGWLAPMEDESKFDEGQMNRAAGIARAFGLEIRDRIGTNFQSDNDLNALRVRMVYEYRSRFATAIMFGLPALALHYIGPTLTGDPTNLRKMFYPWMIECLLVGWLCIAAGWPILWQGGLSLFHLRPTADLLTSAIVMVSFVPSTIGIFSALFFDQPWFIVDTPIFYATNFTIILAVLQRWLLHRVAGQLSGQAMLMLSRFGRLIVAWIIVATIAGIAVGWRTGLAFALLLPPLASLAAINPWNPLWASILPTLAFAGIVLMDPLIADFSLAGVRIEVVSGVVIMQTVVMALGWRYLPRARRP